MTEETAQAIPNTGEAFPSEILHLIEASRAALTDSMVERLATAGSNMVEVADRLNDEDTRAALITVIDKLTDLYRCGALETMFDLVFTIHSARTAFTDSMIERMFSFAEHMINNVANEEVATGAHNARRAMEEAVDEVTANPGKGGLVSTLSMMSSAEAQQAFQFMLAFGKNMQRRTAMERAKPPII